MKFFVTGHRGYIGCHLVELLKEHGHTVTGCDINLFKGCEWTPPVAADRELVADVRSLTESDLSDHDCVVHLAAISNDPMGDLNPDITFSINRDGSIHLARVAKAAGVPRFLFSSSCSIYGQGEKLDLDESDAVNPLTAYAKSKIDSETAISRFADEDFCPIFLRNSTAYGHSTMLRIDLVVNNLLACAVSRGDIRIMSDGSPWRPLIHCRDIARAFIAFAEAPVDVVRNQIVNVGANCENYQVRDVGDRVHALVPSASIVYTGEVGADPRNYRVNFDLLSRLLPDFRLEYSLASGMEELFRQFKVKGFSVSDFEGDRYVRFRVLKQRLHLIS